MSSANAKLIFEIAVESQQALKNLLATEGGLQTLTQQAQAAQVKLGAIDAFKALKADTIAAKTAWEEATTKVAALAKEIGAAETPSKALVKEFESSKRAAALAKETYQASEQQLAKLRATMAAVGLSTKDLAAEQKQLTAALGKAKAEAEAAARLDTARGMLDVRPHKEIRAEIERVRQAYRTLKDSGTLTLRELYQAEIQLKNKTAELEQATNGWTASFGKARAGLLGLAGVGYAAMQGFQSYGNFAQRVGEISTLIDDNAASLDGVKREMIDISLRIPQSADSLAAAEYDILSAGVALEDSTRVLEQAAQAAVAGVTDTKTAVNVGLGVVNAYGLKIGELGNVYDVLFQTVKLGVTTFPELSQHLGETLPTAKAAGVDYRDLGAAIAELTKAGIRTPQATTALKGAINALAAPAPEAKKVYDELGITWKGLIPTLEQIAKKNLSLDQMRLLIPDVEARTGVLALTQHLDGLKASSEAMATAGGSTKAAYDKMKDTPNNQLQIFKNTVAGLTLSVMELASNALLPGAQALQTLLSMILSAPAPVQALIGTLAVGTGGLTLWHLGLKNVADGIRGMLLELPKLSQLSMSVSTIGQAGEGAAAGVSKTGAALSALAVGVAAYQLGTWAYNEFGAVRDAGTYLVAGLAMTWEQAKHNALTAIAVIKDGWASIKAGKVIDAATVAETKRHAEAIAFNATFLKEQLQENDKQVTANATVQGKLRVALAKAGAGEVLAAEINGAKALESEKERLRQAEWKKVQEDLAIKEKLLKAGLEQQMIALDAERRADRITKQEHDARKLEAEQQLNTQVLTLRSEAAAKSAEIYGQDSKAYAGAALAKAQAETTVSKGQAKLEDDLKNSTGLTKTLESALRSMGSAGASAGALAAAGVGQVGNAAQAEKAGVEGRAAGRQALAEEVNGAWQAIDVIKTFSKEKLTHWFQDNQKYLYGQSGGDSFDILLLQHARDVYRTRANELAAVDEEQGKTAAQAQRTVATAAEAEAQRQAVAFGQEASKTVVIQFKDPNGSTISGTFDEPSAGQLVEMLQRSAMVTA